MIELSCFIIFLHSLTIICFSLVRAITGAPKNLFRVNENLEPGQWALWAGFVFDLYLSLLFDISFKSWVQGKMYSNSQLARFSSGFPLSF